MEEVIALALGEALSDALDRGPAAIVLKQWLKPVGSDVFFPPTYANPSQRKGDPPVYNVDRFENASHSVCVIDSIPSQANRIEPAFGRVSDKEGHPIRLVPTIIVKAKVNGQEKEVNLLEAGHRAAGRRRALLGEGCGPQSRRALRRAAGARRPDHLALPPGQVSG
jgi:hypothetical protein